MSKPLWQAPLRGEYYADDDAHYITDAVDNVIAEIPPVHGRDAKEMANIIAHRVNTYPALVEALEAIAEAAQNVDVRDSSDSDIALWRINETAKAALEAAKGDSDANTE